MLKRYPHNVKIIIQTETSSDDGISEVTSEEINIVGRFEPNASKSKKIDYKAKFYCASIDYLNTSVFEEGLFEEGLFASGESEKLGPFKADGQTLIYEGKKFEIVMFYAYQTHVEIWLE